MSIEGTDLAAHVSNASLQKANSTAQVKVLNSQRHQQEAVVGKLLEGISTSAPRAPEQSGHAVNLKA